MNGEMLEQHQDARVNELLEAGRAAFNAGSPRQAHDLWREAASLDPYDERVWVALLDVLETDADVRVCLENILAINPLNVGARRQLRALEARAERIAAYKAEQRSQQKQVRRKNVGVFWRSMLKGIGLGLLGVLIGVIASIILYLPR